MVKRLIDNNKKIKVSAVVVTYNRLPLLKECIAALLQQPDLSHIIVVDNNSTKDTQDYLSNLGNEIEYLRLEKNIGGAGGFYTGVKYFAEHTLDDYVWVMDDDTIPEADALHKLLVAAIELPDAGFFASNPKWIDGSPAIMNVPVVAHPMWTEKMDRKHAFVAINRASFVSIMINRLAILKVGLPLKQFFIWGDDTEYTERIKREFSAYFVPNSIVIHKMKKNQDVDILRDSPDRVGRYYYAYRNRLYNARQRSRKEVIRYWVQFIITFSKVLFKPNKGRLKKLCVMLQGMWSGLWFRPKVEFVQKSDTY